MVRIFSFYALLSSDLHDYMSDSIDFVITNKRWNKEFEQVNNNIYKWEEKLISVINNYNNRVKKKTKSLRSWTRIG